MATPYKDQAGTIYTPLGNGTYQLSQEGSSKYNLTPTIAGSSHKGIFTPKYAGDINLQPSAVVQNAISSGETTAGNASAQHAAVMSGQYQDTLTKNPIPDRMGSDSNVGNQIGALNASGGTTGNTNNLAGQYQALLGLSPEEQAAQKAIQDQQNASMQGQFNVSQQPIAQSFISGQQAAMQTQSDLAKIPLQMQLANAQQKRQASLDAVKFGLERADKETARQDELKQQAVTNKYNEAVLKDKQTSTANEKTQVKTQVITDASGNDKLINTQTGEVIKDLGGGSLDTSNKAAVKAFQQANGLVADGIVGPKTLAKMSEKGISAKGKETSGGAPTVAQQQSAIQKTLSTGVAPSGQKIGNGRGPDGYVDPYVYKTAFENWTGSVKDFLAEFPVDKNVNPASYKILPAALQPKSSSRGA